MQRRRPKLLKYDFSAKVWKHPAPSGWLFVTLPKRLAATIRRQHGLNEEGWGRLKTMAKIGTSSWETAIWYDRKAKSYLLPIKAVIRKTEKIDLGSHCQVRVVLEQETELLEDGPRRR